MMGFFRRASAIALVVMMSACSRESDRQAILGTLEWDRVDLVAEASEPLLEIAVREGEVVAAGALIARLDDSRFRREMEAADAEVTRLEALLAEQRNGARPEELDEARARADQSATLLRNAEQERTRIAGIRARGLVSAAELDRADNNRAAQAAELKAVRARLALLERGTRAETVAQTEAAIAAATARRGTAALRVDRMTINAPRAGRIESLPLEVGDQPGAGVVVARMLVGTSPYARLYLPEHLRARVREGSVFTLTVEGTEGSFQGRARAIASEPSFTPYYALTGADSSRLVYRTEVELTDAAARDLPAGLPVTATLTEPPP